MKNHLLDPPMAIASEGTFIVATNENNAAEQFFKIGSSSALTVAGFENSA